MKQLLMGFAIAAMLFIGCTNPAEARNDVYVTSEHNWDYYVDTDSIGVVDQETSTCVYYMVDRARTAPNKVMRFKAYFYPDGKNTIGYTINGKKGTCSPGSTIYAIDMYVLNYIKSR